MNEKNRPSKKQYELLEFIDGFIKTSGYGPSYREVMRALDYKSVSTVAIHINGLIACGLLRKTDNSARSLEVIRGGDAPHLALPKQPAHGAWLLKEIATRKAALKKDDTDTIRHEIAILEEAVGILKFDQASPADV